MKSYKFLPVVFNIEFISYLLAYLMRKASWYPTKDKPTIMDVNLTVSQVSRVAVIGANGAGKSTATH